MSGRTPAAAIRGLQRVADAFERLSDQFPRLKVVQVWRDTTFASWQDHVVLSDTDPNVPEDSGDRSTIINDYENGVLWSVYGEDSWEAVPRFNALAHEAARWAIRVTRRQGPRNPLQWWLEEMFNLGRSGHPVLIAPRLFRVGVANISWDCFELQKHSGGVMSGFIRDMNERPRCWYSQLGIGAFHASAIVSDTLISIAEAMLTDVRCDDMRPANAFHAATDGLISADMLRKARKAGRLAGELDGARWKYSIAEVARVWPEHSDALRRMA